MLKDISWYYGKSHDVVIVDLIEEVNRLKIYIEFLLCQEKDPTRAAEILAEIYEGKNFCNKV